MNQHLTWKPINHPDILPGYLVSPQGYIKAKGMNDEDVIIKPSYHSTNGYDFMLLNNKNGTPQLFPLDDIITMAYIDIPVELKGKLIKVSHINGDTRDISLENIEWVEDIEEWKEIKLPISVSKGYKISSWGRVKNPDDEILSCGGSSTWYHRLWLRKIDGDRTSLPVHRIQAVMFGLLPDYYDDKQVNHIDGDKTNNYLKNLEVVTPLQNLLHAYMTGLHKVTSDDEKNVIKELLVRFDGSIVRVYDYITNDRILRKSNISKNIIQRVKSEMASNGVVFGVTWNKKIDNSAFELISKLLIEFDGNCSHVLEHIQGEYPDITLSNVYSVRKKLKPDNIFRDHRRNRKISEKTRGELLQILDSANLSPSKAFDIIKNYKRFDHVTVYDLKYLKRKYRA